MKPQPTYPALPTLAPRGVDETLYAYGVRAFTFVLTTDVTATLDTDALELARHVFPLIVSAPDLEPSTVTAYARTLDEVCAAMRRRAKLDAEVAPADAPAAVAPVAPAAPTSGGRKAPVQPRPIVPTAPAGVVTAAYDVVQNPARPSMPMDF